MLNQFVLKPICWLSLLGLVACQSIQDVTIPLETPFLTQAQQFSLAKPGFTLSDKAYAQQLGPYQIDQTKTSGRTTITQSDSFWSQRRGQSADIFDHLFLAMAADAGPFSRNWVSSATARGKQHFSFRVSAEQQQMTSHCQLQIIDKVQEVSTITDAGYAEEAASVSQRQLSALVCDLQQGQQQWQLRLQAVAGKPALFSLSQPAGAPWLFQPVEQSLMKVNNQWQQMPEYGSQLSGLSIQQNGQTQAAVSFAGDQQKIWLANALPATDKMLLLSLSFSLSMYNWLDSEWRLT